MKRYSPLLLVLLLLGATAGSQLAPAVASATVVPAAFEEFEAEEDEGEFEEFEIEDCEAEFEEGLELEEFDEAEEEEFELEAEECGEAAASKKRSAGGAVSAPAPCLVRHAESKITTLPASDRIELTVRYSTYSPAAVSIGLKLKDGKGTLGLEHAVKHLGLGGTLHLSTRVANAVMERAADAKEFDISLRAGNTPGYCGDLLEQHLRTSHPVGRARVYSDPRGT